MKKLQKTFNPEILNLRNPENQYRGPTTDLNLESQHYECFALTFTLWDLTYPLDKIYNYILIIICLNIYHNHISSDLNMLI